ncbi:unnamed protein product [Clonostachys rosea]|uniref:Uncharacterized protein n=1 Tax=Bionectria ochroleuca TaxID=29856 RepID=A0ABY6V476_BIOOC|nr:unnamed protein product [Clonostachys rosea]
MASRENSEAVGNINPEDIPDLGSDDEPCVDDVESATEEEIQLWWTARYDKSIVKPIKEPLTAPWGLPVNSKDLEKLKAGFRTRSMDDKWDLLVEDPDGQGNISLHILRNLAYTEYFILHIVSYEDGGGAVIQDITWEGNNDGFRCEAEQAQKEAVVLCRLFLECEFETVPKYPSSVIWSPEGYKKLEAQQDHSA